MIIYQPYPPPNPEWPDYVKTIYESGCRRIDVLREQMQPDGVCPIPFRCYLCDQLRSDFSFLNGDGVPICVACCPVPEEERQPEGAR